MLKGEHFVSAMRITEAIRLLSESYQLVGGIKPDMSREYPAIQAWIWIPSFYSVIEQGMKLIVKSYGTNYNKGHRLEKVYNNLNSKHKDNLSLAYKHYVSLHDYIPYKKIELFLHRIDNALDKDGDKQDGYTAWRYFLLDGFNETEESSQPKNSAGAMLEISVAIKYILEDEFILEKSSARTSNVEDRLNRALHDKVAHIARKYCLDPEAARQDLDYRDIEIVEYRAYYRHLYDLLTVNVGHIIRFLNGSAGAECKTNSSLNVLCKFMKNCDRENFLQLANKVWGGKRSFCPLL